MTTKIVDLKGKAFKPEVKEEKKSVVNQVLVDSLKEMLKHAESGYVQELCAVAITSEGGIFEAVLDTAQDPEKMFGALTHLGLYYRDLRINPFTVHLLEEMYEEEE